MSKLTPYNLCVVLGLFASFSHAASQSAHFSQLKGVEISSPFCDGARQMDVSNEYFVEIANALPGRDDYNALIQMSEKKDWKGVDGQIDIFRKVYESSPLIEAVAFLAVQSQFEQVETPDPDKMKAAEKELRQTLLLYPKSTLVPVITVNAAAFNIRMGNFQKALSLFESARHDYPFHALSCHIQAGIGESAFLLHEYKSARSAFEQVLQKCTDRVERLHAEMRLADLRTEKEPMAALKIYEDTAVKFPILLGRAAPWAYFNAGELKYRQGQYPSAKFYFNEFLRYGKKEYECSPWALKRIADISSRTKQPMDVVVGNYLALNERAPLTDVGRYGKIHAHLLELDKVSEAEAERRLKVFDEVIDKVHSDEIRTLLFLEKGLAELSIGEKAVLPYLLHLSEKRDQILKKTDVMDFIRANILNVLRKESAKISQKNIKHDGKKDKLLLEPFEEAYGIWLKGTNQEKEAQILYRQLLLERFEELLDASDTSPALSRLDRWVKSGLWPKNGDRDGANELGMILLRFLQEQPDEDRAKFAKGILGNKDVMQPFMQESNKAAWVGLYLASDNLGKVKELLGSSSRGIASIESVGNKTNRSYFALSLGKGYRALKRYQEAETALVKVTDPEIFVEAQKELVALYGDSGRITKQVDLAVKLLPKISKEEIPALLKSIEKGMAAIKQWNYADVVFKSAEKAKFTKDELAPFYVLRGKSAFERTKWKEAIDLFETAITIKKEYSSNPELKFQLAKSYLKAKERAHAQKIWEEVVGMKDPFWSSLAQNELNLLEPK